LDFKREVREGMLEGFELGDFRGCEAQPRGGALRVGGERNLRQRP
jgi:hypothetical protein